MEPQERQDLLVRMEQMVQQDLLDLPGQWVNKVNRDLLGIVANLGLMVMLGQLDPLDLLDSREPLVPSEDLVPLDHPEKVDLQDLSDFSDRRDHQVQMAKEDWTAQRVIRVSLVPTASKV